MKIGSIWTNKRVLKGLEKVSEHGASFAAATSFAMASIVRPVSISLTPHVKKENKEYAITNSVVSGIVKFAFVEAVTLPVENAVKNIEKNPEKFLKKDTVSFFKKNNSKDFKFLAQFLKLSTGLITAIPKSMITVALIPVLIDKLFTLKKEHQQQPYSPSFKGKITDNTAKGIGKIFDIKLVQNFSKKFSSRNSDIARDMSVSTDLLLTASFAHQTMKNEKIDSARKNPLIMNTVYGTAATVLGGCTIDKLIKKNTKNFIKNFTELHKGDLKLHKYIEGINIVRPTLIFSTLYYGILPMITMYFADKTDYK